MDSKYARSVAALSTAAKLAKDKNTHDEAIEFIRKNASYFPKMDKLLVESSKAAPNNASTVPIFAPLNSKNKNLQNTKT